jgi:hypothetical protein
LIHRVGRRELVKDPAEALARLKKAAESGGGR